MVDENATHTKRVRTMKQHLASVHAGALWAQDVVANHLEHLAECLRRRRGTEPATAACAGVLR